MESKLIHEPRGDYLLLEEVATSQRTSSGLFMPDNNDALMKGLVLGVSDMIDKPQAKKGEVILFHKNVVLRVTFGGKPYIMIRNEHVLLTENQDNAEIVKIPVAN